MTHPDGENLYRVTCQNCGHTMVFRLAPKAERMIAGMICRQCGGSLTNSDVKIDRGDGPPDPRRQQPL